MAESGDEDRRFVDRARSGDFAAFEALVSKYERRLFRVAYRIVGQLHDAEEVVQQTLLSAVEHLDEFRQASTFYTWLVRIATNHALTLLRRRRVRQTVPLDEENVSEIYADLPHPQYIARWQETPDEIALRHESQSLLSEALAELDEKYRLVFVLRDIEGLSTQETAEALGISPANVKVRLLRARLMLRERLTRAFGDGLRKVIPDHSHG